MANRKRLQTGGTSIGFRPIGGSLSRSEQRLKEQADIRIDAIKLAKLQHKDNTNLKIEGQADKARFEQNVTKEKQRLEGLVRNQQYSALSIKADRDVDAYKGRADEAEKYAKHLEGLLPQRAALITQGAKLGLELTEKISTFQKLKELEKDNKFEKPNYANAEAQGKLNAEILNKLNDKRQDFTREEKTYLVDKFSFSFKSLGNEVYGRFSDNHEIEQAAVEAWAKHLKIDLNQYNSDDFYEFAGYMRLQELGVSATSEGGRKILAQFKKWGQLKRQGYIDHNDADRTSRNTTKFVSQIKGILSKNLTGDSEEAVLNRKDLQNTLQLAATDIFETGVWIDDKTGAVTRGVGYGGKASAVVYVLQEFAMKHGHEYDSNEAFWEAFAGINALPDKNGVPSTEKLYKKLSPDNILLVEKAREAAANQAETARKVNAVSEGVKLKSEFGTYLTNWLKVKNGDGNFQKAGLPNTLEGVNNLWIKRISASEANPEVKITVLQQLNLMGDGAKYHQQFLNVIEPISDFTLEGQNLEDALLQVNVRFAELTPTLQTALRPEFEKYTNVLKANFGSTGDWLKHWTNKFDSAQGVVGTGINIQKKGLSESGKIAAKYAYARSVEIYTDLLPDFLAKDPVNGYVQARKAAFKIVEEEWKEGAPSATGEAGTGVFARKSDGFLEQLMYIDPKFDPSGSTFTIAQLKARNGQYQGKLATAMLEWRNVNIPVKPAETIAALFYTGEISMDDIFKEGDLVSPDHLNQVASVGAKLAQPYQPGENWRGDVSIKVTPQVTAIAKALGWSEMDVYNEFFQRYGHNVRFAADRPDASIVGTTVNGTRQWDREPDRFGASIFGSIINQGFHAPKKEHIRLGFEEGLDTQTSFFQSHGINVDEGGNFFDPADAINQSVVQQPFFDEEMMNKVFPFGLQGVQHLIPGREAYNIEQLEKSKPKSTYISPYERKHGRKK